MVIDILQQLKVSNRDLQNSANELAVRDFSQKEEVVEQVLNDSDLITQLITDYQKVHINEKTFEKYRENVIKVLVEDSKVQVQKPAKLASSQNKPTKSRAIDDDMIKSRWSAVCRVH